MPHVKSVLRGRTRDLAWGAGSVRIFHPRQRFELQDLTLEPDEAERVAVEAMGEGSGAGAAPVERRAPEALKVSGNSPLASVIPLNCRT